MLLLFFATATISMIMMTAVPMAVVTTTATAQQQEQGQVQGKGQQGYIADSLFIALFLNGDALVEYDITLADPLAERTAVTLFAKRNIDNLIVVDYDDNVIEYETGQSPNEIVLLTPGVSNIRISYTTPDLVNKVENLWTFSLNSTSSFLLRLPPDSVLVDTGETRPTIKEIGDQYLLTFDRPGSIRVVYAIGVLGTEEQANLLIKAADTTIKEISNKYPGIVLTSAKDLLNRAMDARDDGKFADAEKLAEQANDAAVATSRDYEAARAAIAEAEEQIRRASDESRDIVAANNLLQRANGEFANGNYITARNLAGDAVAAIGDRSPEPSLPVSVIVAAAVAAAAVGIGALVFLKTKRTRHLSAAASHQQQGRQQQESAADRERLPRQTFSKPSSSAAAPGTTATDDDNNDVATTVVDDAVTAQAEKQQQFFSDNNDTSAATRAPPLPTSESSIPPHSPHHNPSSSPPPHHLPSLSPSSTTTAGPQMPPGSPTEMMAFLSRIVGKILQERPHLRPEDQQVLQFLAEKEGAAFESEIRSRFQLPKTTIWRLVKRLEREDLVEVRKAGGQNLIKLRFEDKQQL